jgi:hypothetical protein
VSPADQVRDLEARLTPEQRHRAFELAKAHCWAAGSLPPAYVWVAIFRHVIDGAPLP